MPPMIVMVGIGVGSPVKLKSPETLFGGGAPEPLPFGLFASLAPDPI